MATDWTANTNCKCALRLLTGSGNPSDSTSNGNNTTLSSMSWASMAGTNAPAAPYMLTNTSSGHLTFGASTPASMQVGTNDFSVTFWYRKNSTSATTFFQGAIWNIVSAGGGSTIRFTDWINSVDVASASGSFDDGWHHFALTRQGTALKLYIDGTATSYTTTQGNFWKSDESTCFWGTSDKYSELGFFNGLALTSANVTEIMTYGLAGTWTGGGGTPTFAPRGMLMGIN